jgi:ferric-dicitrate binding protein FerR (iron transport regulator)
MTPETRRLQDAAHWFAARRRGVMSLEERRDFNSWMGDRANAAALAEMERVWTCLDGADLQFADAKAPPPRRTTLRANRALVAAMCVVSLGIGILSYSGDAQFWTTLDWTDR